MSRVEMPEPVYAKYRIGNPLWIDREEWRHTGVITVNGYIRHIEKVNTFNKPGEQGYGQEVQVEWLITTTQAEAYAAAKVREALKKVLSATRWFESSEAAGVVRQIQYEVRNLIPPTTTKGEE